MGLAIAAGSVLVVLIGFYIAIRYGSQVDGINPEMDKDPSNFVAVVVDTFRGKLAWPVTGTWIMTGVGGVLLVLVVFVLVVRTAGRKNRSRADHAARFMGTERDLAPMLHKNALKKSARLGVSGNPGVLVGRLLLGGKKLYSSFEDMMILLAGPRSGKSTSFIIPAVMAAPGAVVTTSNKRDVVDATRDPRAAVGPVWVFDPQRVALEEPTWWWNPLSYVTDDTKAAKMAQHFASGTTAPGAKTDAYFDGKGQNLLAAFLLAAAVGKRPITDVYEWLTNVSRVEPVTHLEKAGYRRLADSVSSVQQATEKQRDGIYSSAERMVACLNNTAIERWVNPDPSPVAPRPQFDPHAFVRGRGTLYSLSKEGAGNAGPLVTALTAATIEAAEELASNSRGGRLATPLLGLLDEAANVCRWTDLPDLYSHFGSRGIPIMSVFQSYSQGVAVFGQDGMRKLWSASNVKLYAGGLSEEFVEEMSKMIGDRDRETTSVTLNKGVRSTSSSLRRERILGRDELEAFPRGRAVMFSSGNRPAMLRTVPWFEGDKVTVDAINASNAAHQPRTAEPGAGSSGQARPGDGPTQP
ncbi:TraM recognition domain-containing protein [Rathayibacter sp. VKM Ac-2929]|uniref:type IV secretory system conjugative DNA transfer family protein n=1 Tax=Rathayibacter sp. VKM Ac-2929 TaxID=2929480 RepID=UPI001FB22A7E|nr:TraM recognition domain-containing protein [Rathayibacter sp. VKM Ac-2929]MCJ1675649.1 TraM recognition domain-containing protein [Rathayibacter sp. VKM Ac-2929]